MIKIQSNRRLELHDGVFDVFHDRQALYGIGLDLVDTGLDKLESAVEFFDFEEHGIEDIHVRERVEMRMDQGDFLVNGVKEIDAELEVDEIGVFIDDGIQDVETVFE